MVIFDLYEITFKRDAQSLSYQVELTARADSKVIAEVESQLAPGNIRAALNNQELQGELKVYPWYSGFGVDLENEDATLVSYEIGERQTSVDDECYRLVTISYQESIIETVGVSYEDKKTDPIDWEPQIIIREVTREVPAEALTFLGAYQVESVDDGAGGGCRPCIEQAAVDDVLVAVVNNVVTMNKNSCLPIMTTAGEPKPAIDVQASDDEITIVRWTLDTISSNDEESCFKNTINSAEFTIDLPKQKYKQTFPKYTVRLNAIQKELKEFTWEVSEVQQRRLYWEKRYVLMFRPDGWYQDVANSGHFRAAGEGDPKEGGGLITLSDLLETEPLNVQIRRDGYATGTHMLDLAGQPEWIETRSTFLRYIEPQTDFRSVRLKLPVTEQIEP